MKAEAPYNVQYGGLKLAVLPWVYAPEFFDDSLWFARELKKIVGRKSLLEIGTGTGIIAILCARAGAAVTMTDINPVAIENARMNARRLGYILPAVVSDVYDALSPAEIFDYIFWTHPFNDWDIQTDALLATGIDPRYRSLRKYIRGARTHLRPGGKLLLGTGDSANIDAIESIAGEYGYRLKLLAQSERPLGAGVDARVTNLLIEFVPA